jgi:multidrug efflux pump subunit AcrA (membrane-fusion protein)
VAFAANGRLLELYVRNGDRVAEGELIAALDDEGLQDALVDADLAVRQAENSLAQAQLTLDNLLNWEPDETAVAQAEASLAAAEAGLEQAQSQDSVAYSNLTAARVRLEQAERSLARAQEEYDTAFDPGREWELYIDDPSCRTGEQYPNCTGEPYSDRIEREREWAPLSLSNAEDELEIAQANYSLAVAGLESDSAVSAEASLANARQVLNQALSGPAAEEIAAARLQVEQALLSLEQAQINQEKARQALEDAQLVAPQAGTVVAVNSAPGSFVSPGTPVVTLLDINDVQFQTNNFSERDLAQVAPGQPALVTLKAYPNDPLDGRILRVVPVAGGTIGDAATFTVIIELDRGDGDLLPGMTGRVEISSD